MLDLAHVNKLRCNFVNDAAEYFKCKKYSLECCLNTVTESFLDFKLASNYACPLEIEQECRLVNVESTVDVVECNSQSFVCSLQASIKVSSEVEEITYTTTLENKANQSAFPVVEISNGLYPKASINIVTRDNYGNTFDTHAVTSGTLKIGGFPSTSTDYDLGGSIVFRTGAGLYGTTGGYIQTVRLYRTDSNGVFNPSQWVDIDVSPTSPYLTTS